MKKLTCIILTLIMIIGVVPFGVASAAADSGFEEYDFMMLIDRSTSMLSSDRNDVSIEAAKMFIDTCEISNSRVSIVRFSLTNTISRFFTLNTISSRNAAKAEIDKMEISTGSMVGTALLKSANYLLQNGDPERKKFMVLLSDGGLDTSDVSRLEEASKLCKEESIPVYIIGVVNSTWEYDDEASLSKLAEETGGDFLLATSIDNVPDFFRGIFSKLHNTTVIEGPAWEADGNYYVVPVDVKDTFMSYADVNVSSGKELEDVYIEAPDGKRVAFDDVNFIRAESRLYNYIRLVEPEKGTWKVYIKGVAKDQIHVSYIINYAVEVVPFVTKDLMTATDYGKIGAKLILRGSEPADKDFYEFMSTAYATVKCGSEQVNVPLEYDEELDCLSAEYIPAGVGESSVDAFVMCEYFQRQNAPEKAAKFMVGNSAPLIIGGDETLVIDIADKNDKVATVFYKQLFSDPNGDDMTFTIKSSKRGLDIEELSDSFTVTSDSPCDGTVVIVAADTSGASSEYTLHISVIDSSLAQRRIITACIAALIIIILIIAFLCTKRVRGFLTVSMEGAAPKGPVTFSLESMRRKTTLKEVINYAKNRYLSEYSLPVSSGFEEMVIENSAMLDKIVITGTEIALPKKLTFTSKGNNENILINGMPVKSGKLTMHNGQYFNISIEGYERYTVSLNYVTDKKKNSVSDFGF